MESSSLPSGPDKPKSAGGAMGRLARFCYPSLSTNVAIAMEEQQLSPFSDISAPPVVPMSYDSFSPPAEPPRRDSGFSEESCDISNDNRFSLHSPRRCSSSSSSLWSAPSDSGECSMRLVLAGEQQIMAPLHILEPPDARYILEESELVRRDSGLGEESDCGSQDCSYTSGNKARQTPSNGNISFDAAIAAELQLLS